LLARSRERGILAKSILELRINLPRSKRRVIVADAINEVIDDSVGGKMMERNVDGNGNAVIARESLGLMVYIAPCQREC